ncbi:hypothetical protein AVEN_156826-1 [Araneus ventricosus]|uniref:Uncharacterized protein n=1 Tax=Araneus ventricosus TaxID=182803 RepID=A0A4Y2VZC1_ARAVE|nr:hypothetical protein AVEN_249882-1 [Araneus ventricosus]GBO29714.1 hypothetical protein AVEN_156826-1 [Araneus ventricosus]
MIHHDTGSYTKDAKSIETIKLSEHQDNRSVRIKREAEEDSLIYFDLDKAPKAEKGIKIVEQEPGETQCNYNQCVEICNTIYFAIPIHLAQCYNNTCFCFPKKDLYPPAIKNFMKTHKLFGIQQTYE